MNNLYTLTAHQQAMSHQLEAAGFDDQTISDTLEGEENSLMLLEKRCGYIAIIKAKRARAKARHEAAGAIVDLAYADEEDAHRLERALFTSMIATGDKDVIGLEFEARIKGKAPAVLIKDLAKVPAQYMRLPEPVEPKAAPDKKAIGDALKKGEFVDGCELGPNKKLEIK